MKLGLPKPVHWRRIGPTGGATTVIVELRVMDVTEWCSAVSLLNERLTDRLEVPLAGSESRFLLVDRTLGSSSCLTTGNQVSLSLTESALGYLLAFLLKCYRDGEAEVDHLDFECAGNASFVVKIDRFSQPMTAGEARRRLGL